MLKVISIGTDRKLFEENSAVLVRNIEYAKKMEELHIVVFSLKKLGLRPYFVDNLYIYPTNSLSRFHYIFDAIKIGKKIIIKGGFGKNNCVISTQDPFETGFVGYYLAKKFNLSLQLQIHTDFLSSYFENSPLNFVRARIAKFLIPRTDGLRVVSSIIVDSIKNHFPNLKARMDILPIFVDVEDITNSLAKKSLKEIFTQFEFRILMASRLTKEKKINTALCVLKRVVEKFPQTGLVIAGDGDQRKNLENMTKKFGLYNNVVFLGWQNDLISLYKTADLFLLTSEYEGYGMTLIEAGVSGCPIVTTGVGVAKTSLFKNNENSFICSVNDIDCLSSSVVNLIENYEKRKLFKERMQDSIKKTMITKEEYVTKYVNLLEVLLKK